MHSAKSIALVTTQFACLGWFALNSPLSNSLWGVIVQGLGIALGVWAVWTVRPWKVSVFPEPSAKSSLVVHGPFRWIRHPMYSALLMVCLPIVFQSMHWLDGIVYTTLMVNQVIKLSYEEKMLERAFSEYSNYQKRSWRLIPWVF